jgi:cytoplasmic iron level regulating protein YaaA (DUF328/UPF0246 family)
MAGAPGRFDDILETPRTLVARALAETLERADDRRVAKLLNVSAARVGEAREVTAAAARGSGPLLPSWRRYEGVVWGHLRPGEATAGQRRRLLIPNALYGLNTGTDAVGEYRLKFTVSLDGIGSLARFWRDHLGRALNELGRVEIIDLLPDEHHRAIEWTALRRPRYQRVRFVSADESSVVGHDAKAAKGALARHLLDSGAEGLEAFEWRGWRSVRRGENYVVLAPSSPGRHEEFS